MTSDGIVTSPRTIWWAMTNFRNCFFQFCRFSVIFGVGMEFYMCPWCLLVGLQHHVIKHLAVISHNIPIPTRDLRPWAGGGLQQPFYALQSASLTVQENGERGVRPDYVSARRRSLRHAEFNTHRSPRPTALWKGMSSEIDPRVWVSEAISRIFKAAFRLCKELSKWVKIWLFWFQTSALAWNDTWNKLKKYCGAYTSKTSG